MYILIHYIYPIYTTHVYPTHNHIYTLLLKKYMPHAHREEKIQEERKYRPREGPEREVNVYREAVSRAGGKLSSWHRST